jgi:hypothetical protein
MPAAKWLAAPALRRGYGCIQYGHGPRGCVGFPSRALLGWTVRGAHSSGLIAPLGGVKQ